VLIIALVKITLEEEVEGKDVAEEELVDVLMEHAIKY
jgi:hypothetical protein